MTSSRVYGQTSNEVFEKAETKPLEGDDKKSLLVILSSDKGLCGGVHSGMSRAARRLLADHPNTDIAVVGEKCKAQLSRSNPKNFVLSFAGIGKDVPTFADASAIADQIMQLETQYSSVQIMYNKFITRSPTSQSLLMPSRPRPSLDRPTTPHTRLRMRILATCRNMLLPILCSGVLLKVTLSSSLPDETPWITPRRTPER